MKLILSDLHLGSPLFTSEHMINNLLSSSRYSSILLLGDIFDIWENNLEDILKKYHHIIRTINIISNEKEVVYIVGNHDPTPIDIKSILKDVKVLNNYKFDDCIAIHGHQYDSLINKYSSIANYLFYFQWIFERLGLDFQTIFRELYHSIKAKMKKKYYNNLILDIEQTAVESYSSYKHVLMGHTHVPKIVEGKTSYINSGDWTHNYTYVEYNHDNVLEGNFKLYYHKIGD